MTAGLHRRLMLTMAVLLVIGLAVADVVTFTSLRSFLYGRLDEQLSSSQALAVRFCVRAYLHDIPLRAEALSDRISQDVYVIVLSPDGKVLLSRPSGYPYRPDPRPVVPRAVRVSTDTAPQRGPYRPNPDAFVLASAGRVSYRAQAAVVPQGTVLSAITLTQTDATLSSLVRIEAAVSIGVLLVVCGLAMWTVRRGLRPLDAMAETAGAIASGDLSRRVEVTDDATEVGRLGAALNVMLAQIEAGFAEKSDSEARLRQFVADASHELRTPLTSIRGYAELLRKGALPDAADRLRALRRVEHEAARMGGLVDDLLLLARLDQGRPLERVAVDLRRICRDAVDDAQLADPDRAIELVAPVPVTVAGDRDRLVQVAHNLVRNALVHTPPGTPVSVEVGAEGAMGVVRVLDAGPGLTAARRNRVFDRFYRGDAARTGEGTGLGLAIVRAIAEALDGRAWVEARPGGGSVFGVAVPLVADRAAPGRRSSPAEPPVPPRRLPGRPPARSDPAALTEPPPIPAGGRRAQAGA